MDTGTATAIGIAIVTVIGVGTANNFSNNGAEAIFRAVFS
jgi:hypothetical protein